MPTERRRAAAPRCQSPRPVVAMAGDPVIIDVEGGEPRLEGR